MNIKNVIKYLKEKKVIESDKNFEFSPEDLETVTINNEYPNINSVKDLNTGEEYISNVYDSEIKKHNLFVKNYDNESEKIVEKKVDLKEKLNFLTTGNEEEEIEEEDEEDFKKADF